MLLSLLCLFSVVVTLKRTWVIYQWLNSSSVDCAVRIAAVSDHQQWLTWPWWKLIPHSLFFPSLHVSKVHLCKCSSENICCASVCMRLQILVILHPPLTSHESRCTYCLFLSLASAVHLKNSNRSQARWHHDIKMHLSDHFRLINLISQSVNLQGWIFCVHYH